MLGCKCVQVNGDPAAAPDVIASTIAAPAASSPPVRLPKPLMVLPPRRIVAAMFRGDAENRKGSVSAAAVQGLIHLPAVFAFCDGLPLLERALPAPQAELDLRQTVREVQPHR